MKILIVNYYDQKGGAAIAARRVCESLISAGIDAQMLVALKETSHNWIIGPQSKWDKARGTAAIEIDQLFTNFVYPNKRHSLFTHSNFSLTNIIETIKKIKPDLVHLHWVSGSLFNIKNLKEINVPLVLALHDMWHFTGGCHYNESCDKFKNFCHLCPILQSNKKKDLSYKGFNKKLKVYKNLNLNITGSSNWISNEAIESTLFRNIPVQCIPTCINTNTFRALDKKYSRALFNLPLNKKLILFGAMNATSDPRKGFQHIKEALNYLDTTKYELVIFGASEPKDKVFDFNCHYLGKLHDETTLIALYSAVDLFLLPSIQENLSNMVLESLACATPVVAFDIGGNGDMIDHCQNGYLAKPFEPEDFSKGIEWTIENLESCRLAARKKIEENFSYPIIAKKYINLYKSILKLD